MVIPTLTGSCTGTYKMTIIKKYIAAAHFLADNVQVLRETRTRGLIEIDHLATGKKQIPRHEEFEVD